MTNIFDKIYEIFFTPTAFFKTVKEACDTKFSIVVFLLLNTFLYTLSYKFMLTPWNLVWYFVSLFFVLVGGLLVLVILTGFFEMVAYVFSQAGHFRKLFCMLVFCSLPWIFLAPLELLKGWGDVGYFLGVIFEIGLYIWTVFLVFKAVSITYNLSFSRGLVLIFLPIITSTFLVFWLIGFVLKIGYIFT